MKRHDAVGMHDLSQTARPAAASLSPNGTASVVIGRNIAPQSATRGNTRHWRCIIERQNHLSAVSVPFGRVRRQAPTDLKDGNAKLDKRAMVAIAIVRGP